VKFNKLSNDHYFIFKRGEIVEKNGIIEIINEKGERYLVNDTLISIWNMCKGISFEDLLSEFRRIASGNDETIKKSLKETVCEFEKYAIVRIKKC
jgi:hypothetical protein